MLAIQKAVLHFLPLIRGKVVMIHLDSSSAVAYLRNQGGTHSLPMFHLTRQILLECQLQGITLLVRHIPGCLNVLADSLSRRHEIIGTKWSLHPSIVRQMLVHSRVGPLRNSSQQQTGSICVSSSGPSSCSSGCPVNPLGQALGICLSSNCANATSASQISTLIPVSNAIGGTTSALSTLAWWTFPRKVPPLPRLLRQPQLRVFHSRLEQVHPFAWSLSSVACESDSSRMQLPTVSATQLEHLPPVSMTVNGESMRVGVVQNRLVLSKPLFSN